MKDILVINNRTTQMSNILQGCLISNVMWEHYNVTIQNTEDTDSMLSCILFFSAVTVSTTALAPNNPNQGSNKFFFWSFQLHYMFVSADEFIQSLLLQTFPANESKDTKQQALKPK